MRLLIASLLLALLAACGQAGDLYLPDQSPQKTAKQQPEKSDKKKEQTPEQNPAPAP